MITNLTPAQSKSVHSQPVLTIPFQFSTFRDGRTYVDQRVVPWHSFSNLFRKPQWLGAMTRAEYEDADSEIQLEDEFGSDSRSWRPVCDKNPDASPPTTEELLAHGVVIEVANALTASEIRCRLEGTATIVHSLYPHSASSPCWRVIVLLDQPVGAADWTSLQNHLQTKLSCKNQYMSRDLDDWHTLTSCPSDAQPDFEFFTIDGAPLSVAQALGSIDVGRPGPASATSLPSEGVNAALISTVSTGALPPTHLAQHLMDNYCIPLSAERDDLTTDYADLVDEIELLADQYAQTKDYLAIRDQYCLVSLMLNRAGLWAPAFRPEMKLPQHKGKGPWPPETTLMHCDRLVIDCHWLHSRKVKFTANRAEWRPIFHISKPFNYDLAAKMALTERKNDTRVCEEIGLMPRFQVQLVALRERKVAAHVKDIETFTQTDGNHGMSAMASITNGAKLWAEKHPSVRQHVQKHIANGKARALLATTAPSMMGIAELSGLIRGEKIHDESTVRNSLERLDVWREKYHDMYPTSKLSHARMKKTAPETKTQGIPAPVAE